MLRPRGRLAFLAIQPHPDLSSADRRRAHRVGPPHVAVRTSYAAMLATAGFVDITATDITAEYRTTQQRWLAAIARRDAAIRSIVGDDDFDERDRRRRATLAAIEVGLLTRYRFTATRP